MVHPTPFNIEPDLHTLWVEFKSRLEYNSRQMLAVQLLVDLQY